MKTHTFSGRRWKVKDQHLLEPGDLGMCDYEQKTVYIPMEGDTVDELDVIIHEGIHATCRRLCESEVDTATTSIAKLLWRLGWRKIDDSENS